jgi:PAS domain S-box-containing protein
MYNSTLTLSQSGSILKMDADCNDTLFKTGVDYINHNFTSLFYPSQKQMLDAFLNEVFTTGKLQYKEFFYSNSFYQLRCTLIQADKALCFITNNKQTKELRDMDEHNLRAIVDSYVDWVWSFDNNLTLVTANKSYLEFRQKLNLKPIEIGDKIYKNADEAAYKKWMPIYERSLNGETINFEEKRNLNGEDYYVEIYLSPVFNSAKEIIGCLGITRNITERINAQFEIAGYTSKLEEFAFKTSHELRRPIANIIGMTNLMSENGLDIAERNKAIDYIATSVKEVDEIVISMIELMEQQRKNDVA